MRNGMSVKEIYEALDQRDRLVNALEKERSECENLRTIIKEALSYNSETADQYGDIANISKDRIIRLEFLCKRCGLLEANGYLHRLLEDRDIKLV